MLNHRVTAQPAEEPINLAEAKAFLAEVGTSNDALITSLITAARQAAEEYTRRKFISTTITMHLDRFPFSYDNQWWDGVRDGSIRELHGNGSQIALPFAPIVSVTSIKTFAPDDTETVFDASSYRVDTNGYITLKDGRVWPSNLRERDAIQIVYVAGYGATASSVPEAVKLGIKSIVSAWFNHRECMDMPASAESILAKYRIYGDYDHVMR
jgi:hypothetical protein